MPAQRAPFLGWFLLAVAVASLLILFLGWHIYESHRFFGQIGNEFVRQTAAISGIRALRCESDIRAESLGPERRASHEDDTRMGSACIAAAACFTAANADHTVGGAHEPRVLKRVF